MNKIRNNPYTQLIEIFRKEGSVNNQPSIMLGTVLSVNPLKIRVGELQLTKDNLFINYTLLPYNQKFNLDCYASGEVTTPEGTGNVKNITISDKKIEFKTILKTNDLVAIVPTADMQTYIVLCKVV